MPSLKAQLTVKLDASTLVQTFLSNVGGPVGTLAGIADPTPADAVSDVNSQLGGLDLGSLDSTVGVLVQSATSIVGSLPIAGDVVKPVTDALAAIEAVATNPDIGNLETRIKATLGELSGILEGPREGGVLGALHAVALAL